MPLPALHAAPDPRQISERVNRLIRELNRADTRVPIYADDTGSSTAYAIAPIPGIKQYVTGQIFGFKAANANTSTAPTFAVNGLTAGTITYPDGSALVPGDIAANGFYFVQVASTTPTFHLMSTPKNRVLQFVSTSTAAVATGSTAIPQDDTIPQNTEGDQYLSLSITPKSATSTLIIDCTLELSSSAGDNPVIALFQDSTANALAANVCRTDAAGVAMPVRLRHMMTSGTTSSTTFKIRAGSQSGVGGTITVNGTGGARRMGGVSSSNLSIMEVLP